MEATCKIEGTRDQLEDVSAALQANKAVIRDLEQKVEQLELENGKLKEEVDKLKQHRSVTKVAQQGKLYDHA